jgi:hypothetical protein
MLVRKTPVNVNFWQTTYGDWSTAANWSTNTVPAVGDLDIIQSGRVEANTIGIVGQVVWLDSTAYNAVELDLNGSSLGHNSWLYLNSTYIANNLDLQNSSLQGDIFAGSGITDVTVARDSAAVNYGWIGVAGSTATAIDVSSQGNFANNGEIEAGINGSFALTFGYPFPEYGGQQYVFNSGILDADPGGTLGVSGSGGAGTLINLGQINVNGGTVDINATLLQAGSGTVNVNGGTLAFQSPSDGGTINITAGTLDFPAIPPEANEPNAATVFASTVDLNGASATMTFGSAKTVSDVLNANTLTVYDTSNTQPVQLATIHLGGATVYSAAEFTTSGNSVLFAHATS